MGERRSLGHLAREPLYNTRAVAQMTGVPTDTFRAWERRYGLPRPFRTSSNQRLYSEHDIGVIDWLRDRTGEGMTISQAIQRLKLEAPDVLGGNQPAAPSAPEPSHVPQADRLLERFLDAVVVFDTEGADNVIDDALARFSIEAFIVRLVEPAIQEIDQRRSLSRISIAVERFAIRLLVRRLAAILTMVSPRSGRGTIVVAGAGPPSELSEVGLLVLAIALSRRGWRIVDLGQQIPVDTLIDAARMIRPDLICLWAPTDDAGEYADTVARALGSGAERRVPVIAVRAVAAAVDQVDNLVDPERVRSEVYPNWSQRG